MAGAKRTGRSRSSSRDLLWKRIAIVAALLVPVAAIITAFWPPQSGESHTTTVSGTGNQVNQAHPQVSVGPGGCVAINDSTCETTAGAAAERRRNAEALPGAGSAPTGTGPWLFAVYDTGEMGLVVREGTTSTSARIAVVPEGRPVYVDCYRLDWDSQQVARDPLPTMRSDRWYKVRYPSPGDVGEFWMLSGFLFPINHNGDVPACR